MGGTDFLHLAVRLSGGATDGRTLAEGSGIDA
jgi:hypothetical protein